ncbi:hypothetical protein PPERSA_05891 [Pseudocohnilembus persalinus]|uniref:Saccharopine dehydrogenase NADP binding domain-containing protein n=1 Tax=Pseudocohnilembus persalinus TaxID=266149 RepID=A0A0V0R411_PSEPJ|nr:hypothetical protein PPERSA_05891 [Pseudocohnilembus persalinus]|eukprot:KRX09222.1 hypothetical protein PPERSA_05891 [Pseudocohnilembus persalinus]
MRNLTEKQKLDIISRKPKPGSSPFEYVKFTFNLLISVPLIISLGLPLQFVFFLISKCKGKKRPRQPTYLEIDQVAKNKKPSDQRQFDLVVYGATGYTGKLVAQYIAKNYENLKWAIAGRSATRLENVRSQLAKENPQLEQLPIIVADSSNVDQLTKMINDTRVLISTVGPFSLYGNFVVAICAQYGTHYIDSTGEVAWIREMIIRYDSLAVKSGAKLISSCGLDCIPWDIVTQQVSQYLQNKHQDKIKRIEFFDEMQQAFSGGTFATLQTSFLNPAAKTKTDFDPLLKKIGTSEKSEFGLKTRLQNFIGYNSRVKSFVGMWGLAAGNAGIVRRSNALLGYNSSFTYFEALKYTNFFQGFNDQVNLIFLNTVMGVPPLLSLLNKINYFPQPGQGQGQKYLENGYLKLYAYAQGEKGNKVKSLFTLPLDPGYVDTARMLGESAMVLLKDQDQIQYQGGFLTPGVIGNPLMKRLVDSGSIFQIE